MSDFTAEDLARLRVPLSALPGFDPVGLTITPAVGRPRFAGGLAWRRVVAAPTVDYVKIWDPTGWYVGDYDATKAEADASDSSTADRLARWLAARVGLEVGCTAPSWTPKLGPDRWLLRSGCGARLFVAAIPDRVDAGDADRHWSAVPGLPATDFGRRLPDGSLYTDRLALALVAVHVGGGR